MPNRAWAILVSLLVGAGALSVQAQEKAPPEKSPAAGPASGAEKAPAHGEKPAEVECEDYIRTKAGVEFHGKIIEESGEQVVIQTRSGLVAIPRSVIAVMRKAKVDYRSASERIAATPIPEGEAASYLEKAGEHAAKGEHEAVVSICKGLMALKPNELTDGQREMTGKLSAQAYYVLKDWKAAAESLRFAARAVQNEVDRQRLLATAEAFSENTPPAIAGQTAESYLQAQQLAMKWKSDKVFVEAKTFVEETKETNRQEVVERVLKVGQGLLDKAEVYAPGYGGQRWPEVCKALVTRMMETVEKAAAECEVEREWLTRYYYRKIMTVDLSEQWNERCVNYLKLRQAAVDCLENVSYVEKNQPLKSAYSAEEFAGLKKKRDELAKQFEGLKYYAHDTGQDNRIKIKDKVIAPSQVPR